MYTTISTINYHQIEPPYDWQGLKYDASDGKIRIDLLDAFLNDTLYEESQAFSSHIQFILGSANDQKPTAYVIREGSISVDYLREMFKHFGVEVEVYPGAKDTKRVKGVNLDANLIAMRQTADEEFKRQKPKVAYRIPYLTDWTQHGKVGQILENLRLDRI